MSAAPDLWLFFLLVFGVIVLPGMDMAFVAGSALTTGLRGGMTAVAGIVAAGALHVAAGATGVAALLVLWPAAFNALLLAGAVYMVWIGAGILRSAGAGDGTGPTPGVPTEAGAIFRRAAVTCLLNPKAYAFMLAVFPAFIRAAEHSMPLQALRLGAVIALTQFVVYGTVAVVVAQARTWTGASGRGRRWVAWIVGIALIGGAAMTLAFAWQPIELSLAGAGRSPASAAPDSSCRSAAPALRRG